MRLLKIKSGENLIKRCVNNDRLAQVELFNQYKDAMYTLAYRIIGNHHDAEEALQDTFVNVFLKLSSFKGESTIGAWIKTILIRNAVKKNKVSFQYEDIEGIQSFSSYPIDENLSGEAIENAILSLDKGYRTVFVLCEVEGYKHKEIAEILKISEGTSKSQLYHAKKQLQKKLMYV